MRQSDTREILLEYLRTYIREQGYGPSVREICGALGLRSTATVHYHLRQLAEEGSILYDANKKRSIALAVPPEPDKIPVVGVVAAGQPILAVEQIEGYLPWEGGEGWFALRVKGESMKNAGILPGDLVIVRPQPTVDHGQIVVAMIDDEATVKRLSLQNGRVWLLPENEAFSPIDGTDAVILGLVRGVVRKY